MGRRRLFAGVAVEVTEDLRRLVGELTRDRAAGGVRWVRLDNLHLTVEFFGETDEERIPVLEQALARAASQATGPFELEWTGLGTFGGVRPPQVLWLGVESDGLAALHGHVQAALRGAGWTPEKRPFAPHLTLGRGKGGRGAQELRRLAERGRDGPPHRQIVRHLVLFESVKGADGVRYEKRNRWALGGE